MKEAKEIVKKLIEKYHITLISIGNGTASRESELIVVDMLKEFGLPVKYIITNEAGASVYSASKLATEEFPNFDVGQRSAVSIARRVQDPLAELVKIDPKSIGVGMYQHDVTTKSLDNELEFVVSTAVNQVGVNVNTASRELLSYISGLNKKMIDKLLDYKEKVGSILTRSELSKVFSDKVYEQAIGFLRIPEGKNVLDKTSIHPESYNIAKEVLKRLSEKLESGMLYMKKDC